MKQYNSTLYIGVRVKIKLFIQVHNDTVKNITPYSWLSKNYLYF